MKVGRNAHGEQRYRCQAPDCPTKTFMLTYRYRACGLEVKEQALALASKGSGIRDTARVLKINKNTVINMLKKSRRPCADALRAG